MRYLADQLQTLGVFSLVENTDGFQSANDPEIHVKNKRRVLNKSRLRLAPREKSWWAVSILKSNKADLLHLFHTCEVQLVVCDGQSSINQTTEWTDVHNLLDCTHRSKMEKLLSHWEANT